MARTVGDEELTTQEIEFVAPGGTSEYGGRNRPRTAVVAAEESAERGALGREVARGVRAAFEALALSWLILVVPVVAGYVATVADPVLGESSWIDAARNGTAIWLLGFGQEILSPPVSIVPVILPVTTIWLLSGSLRRARIGSIPGIGSVLLTGAVMVAGAYLATGESPSLGSLLVTVGVLITGIAIGWVRSGLAPAITGFPHAEAVRAGLRAGGLGLLVLGVIAGLVLIVAIARSAGQIWQVHTALDPNPMSAFLMVVAQLAMLPTLAVWVLSWLIGPGFSIGAVSVTSTAATTGPLPVLPILAAVPEAGPGVGGWVILLPILAVAVALAPALSRDDDWRNQLTTASVAVVVIAGVGGVLGGLSGGSVGALSVVGTSGWAMTGWLAITATAGALLAAGTIYALSRTNFTLPTRMRALHTRTLRG